MSAGLTVFNDNNVLIIDENNSVMSLRQKGTFTPDVNPYTNAGLSRIYYKDIPFSGYTAPIIALESSNPNLLLSVLAFYTSSGTGYFRCAGVNLDYATPTQITYYIFDKPNPPTSSGFGVQVFASDGSCCFDSNQPVARTYLASNTTGNHVIDSNRRYAISFTSGIFKVTYQREIEDSYGNSHFYDFWQDNIGPCGYCITGGYYYHPGTSVAGGAGNDSGVYYSGQNNSDVGNGNFNPFGLVFDVTNF